MRQLTERKQRSGWVVIVSPAVRLPQEEPNKQKTPAMRWFARRGLPDHDGLPFASRHDLLSHTAYTPACHTSGPFFIRGPSSAVARVQPVTARSPRCGSPNAYDGSTSQRLDELVILDLGPEAPPTVIR